MIDMDNAPFAAFLVIAIAYLGPIAYSFFVDHHKKGAPDPRRIKF